MVSGRSRYLIDRIHPIMDREVKFLPGFTSKRAGRNHPALPSGSILDTGCSTQATERNRKESNPTVYKGQRFGHKIGTGPISVPDIYRSKHFLP